MCFQTPSRDKAEVNRHRSLFTVIFLHGMNDMHSTSLPTIIPLLAQSISLSMGQAGMLNALFGLTNIFGQPVSGFIADRLRRPWFAVWGPLLTIIGASLLPLAPNFGIAFIFVGMMSLGTSLFHPQGFGRCGASAGKSKLAYYLSLFSASGCLGSAIGPLYVVFMVQTVGRRGFPMIVITCAAIICLSLWRLIGSREASSYLGTKAPERPPFVAGLKMLFSKVGWIVCITGARDAAFQSVKIFLPTLLILHGGTIAKGGVLLFITTFCATLSGIVGGRLADKIGDEKVLFFSVAAAPLFMAAGLHGGDLWHMTLLVAGLAILQTSTPVTMAMAQRRCPESRSLVSSLAQGVSWGIANLCVTPVGIAADIIGLQKALGFIVFLPWLAGGTIFLLRYIIKAHSRA